MDTWVFYCNNKNFDVDGWKRVQPPTLDFTARQHIAVGSTPSLDAAVGDEVFIFERGVGLIARAEISSRLLAGNPNDPGWKVKSVAKKDEKIVRLTKIDWRSGRPISVSSVQQTGLPNYRMTNQLVDAPVAAKLRALW